MHIVKFTEGINEITIPGLVQWDSGRKLSIELPDIPSKVEVHFARHKLSKKALVVDAVIEDGAIVAPIPNILLQVSTGVVAWVCAIDEANYKTIKTIYLPVEGRAKPSDYVYTEVEIKRWEDITRMLESWEEDTKNKVVEEAITSVHEIFTVEVDSLKEADAETRNHLDNLTEAYNAKVAELEEKDENLEAFANRICDDVARQEEVVANANATANEAKATADEAKEIADSISGIATKSLELSNRAFSESDEALNISSSTQEALNEHKSEYNARVALLDEKDNENKAAIEDETIRASQAEADLELSIQATAREIEESILSHIVNSDYEENNPQSRAYIENRPFYEERQSENIQMRYNEWFGELNPDVQVYYVSDKTFTKEALGNFEVELRDAYSKEVTGTSKLSEFTCLDGNGFARFSKPVGYDSIWIYIVTDYTVASSCFGGSLTPTKNGVYFTTNHSNATEISRLYGDISHIKKLDNKFLDLSSAGLTYDQLKDKPFYDAGSFKIEMDWNGTSVWNNNSVCAYLVSDKTYTSSELIGATVNELYKYDSWGNNTIQIENEHIYENTSDGLFIKLKDNEYQKLYIFVAYKPNYQPKDFGATLPNVGIYFSHFSDYDNPYVSSLEGGGAVPIDNKFLDLAKHPVIQDIMSRLTRLEGYH